jgi:uncharacterized membrane protein (UPF0136 family)
MRPATGPVRAAVLGGLGLAVLVAGAYAYVAKGSLPSLVASASFGAVFSSLAIASLRGARRVVPLGIGACLLLAGTMTLRAGSTGHLVPGVPVAVAAALVAIWVWLTRDRPTAPSGTSAPVPDRDPTR